MLTAFYDLQHGPVSYDFIVWLVRAMLEQRRRGAARLHVVIVPAENGLGGFARHWGKHDEAATRWRLWHIVLPACVLAGATVTLSATRAQAESLRTDGAWWPDGKAHFAGPLVEAARAGESIPRLEASGQARRYVAQWFASGETVATLTLRQQTTDPARNSNEAAWYAAVPWLAARGYRVVLLHDTNVAIGGGTGLVESDIDLRLALYERAALNVVGNNGPSALLWFSAAPFLMIGAAQPEEPWREHWRRHLHLEDGEQLPWARPDQRLAYRPDDRQALHEELERWVGATS